MTSWLTPVIKLGGRDLGSRFQTPLPKAAMDKDFCPEMRVTATLPSGRSVKLLIPQSSKVGDLKTLAQESLNKRFLRLMTAEGLILTDLMEPLEAAGLRDGDELTVIVVQANLAATCQAFALWCSWGDGVATWGSPPCGGDSSAVQDQLKNVKQVQATSRAFAAILEDGSVVTWGDPDSGGDSSGVQDRLRSVRQIQATDGAFAAILEDGSVVTWGDPRFGGGDSSAVQDRLRSVQQIQATDSAFAAILEDGSVVTWGHARSGGDSSTVQDQLRHVQQLQAARLAFAAILEDGSVVTWGASEYGGTALQSKIG